MLSLVEADSDSTIEADVLADKLSSILLDSDSDTTMLVDSLATVDSDAERLAAIEPLTDSERLKLVDADKLSN